MNIKFIVLVFIGIFLSCLGLSKLANFYFDISSDYLTATATFFAAFVALYLFNDWRHQQKFILLEKYQDKVDKHSHIFINAHRSLIILCSQTDPKWELDNGALLQFMEFALALETLENNIKKYRLFVNDYSKSNLIIKDQLLDMDEFLLEINNLKHSIDNYLSTKHRENLNSENMIKFLESNIFSKFIEEIIPRFTTHQMSYLNFYLKSS